MVKKLAWETVGLAVLALILVGSAFAIFSNSRNIGEITLGSPGQEKLVVQVTAYMVLDVNDSSSSVRDETDIKRLFDEANRIWAPAKIFFSLKEIKTISVDYDLFISLLYTNNPSFKKTEYYSDGSINAYFVRSIDANGISFYNTKSFAVNDITTVNDFRTTAHELGHLLGLQHVYDSRSKLMWRGANGEILSDEEISSARNNAKILKFEFRRTEI